MSDTETKAVAQDSTDAALLAQVAETASETTTKTETTEAPEASKQETEQTDTPKADENKPAEEAKTKTEEFSLKLPEGSLLKPEQVEKISTFAKEKGLSAADAQALLERESAQVSDFQSELVKQYDGVKAKWAEEVKTDKEIGGANFEKSVAFAQKALDRFGPDLKADLDATGFGNNPRVIRMLARIGKAMASDQVIRGVEHGQKKSFEDLLYGETKK